jgi:transketolase
VVLDSDVSKSTMTSIFAKRFPDRFFNAGVAEQNMVSIAAGLSAMGKIPFVSTYGAFASRRACDQVYISVAYPGLNVKICATHCGISVGEDGATHQSLEDVAIMRSMPGMIVISPADGTETRKALEQICNYKGPCYLRLCRGAGPLIFNDNYDFSIGKGVKIFDGDKATIVSSGFTTHIAMAAASRLQAEQIEVDLINMASLKPIDEDLIIESAKKTGLIITVEDHNIIGGLGSAVCELMSERFPAPVIRMGVKDKFGTSGHPSELIAAYEFDENSIIDVVKRNINIF